MHVTDDRQTNDRQTDGFAMSLAIIKTYSKRFLPVTHVLLPLNNKCIRQISNKIEDGSTRSSKIGATEKHAEHEALNDCCNCEHSKK